LSHRTSEEAQNQASCAPRSSEDYCNIDINSFEHQQVRYVGAEHVGVETAKKLGIGKLLRELGFNQRQTNIALGSILCRLIMPGSERATHNYLKNQSGLDELLGCDFQQMSLNSLYKIADKLLKNKDQIEARLFHNEKDLFQ